MKFYLGLHKKFQHPCFDTLVYFPKNPNPNRFHNV